MTATPVADALKAFRASGSPWLDLPFFTDGGAEAVAKKVDARVAAGTKVLPAPENIFRALVLTPQPRVKAVILGQDPYPSPGDANGLAFSYVGPRRLPASLKIILAEVVESAGARSAEVDAGSARERATQQRQGERPVFRTGDLTPWAEQGVLLLNTALTVEAGKAGAHLRLGWARLADEAVVAVSARASPAVFLLWGAQARARKALIDTRRHAVIESGHPSPLNRARDFPGSKPFARANAWLEERGLAPIRWALENDTE